jgi:hypothetical protein
MGGDNRLIMLLTDRGRELPSIDNVTFIVDIIQRRLVINLSIRRRI